MRAFADDGDRRTDADGPAGCCCSAASVPLAFVGVCGWRLRCLSDLWRSRQLVHNLLSTFTSTTPTLFHHEARSFLRSPLWRQRLHGPERRCEFCEIRRAHVTRLEDQGTCHTPKCAPCLTSVLKNLEYTTGQAVHRRLLWTRARIRRHGESYELKNELLRETWHERY